MKEKNKAFIKIIKRTWYSLLLAVCTILEQVINAFLAITGWFSKISRLYSVISVIIDDWFSKWIWFVIVVLIVVGGISGIIRSLNTDANDKYDYDGKFIFIEAKCLMGSVFNKKTLVLSDDNIEIISHSLFGKEKKTVRPYNNIKEVAFSKAFIGYKGYESGYKVVIEYSGGFFNESDKFYFKQKDTFDFLKTVFKDYSKNRCVITESL